MLALDCSQRCLEAAVVVSDAIGNQEIGFDLLLAHGAITAIRAVRQSPIPVHFIEDTLDLSGTVAGSVESADDGAHTGAGDVIDRYVQLLEGLEHAHVGSAAGTAAAQRQANPDSTIVGLSSQRIGIKCGQQGGDGQPSESHAFLRGCAATPIIDWRPERGRGMSRRMIRINESSAFHR